jgi:deoxyribose-phosphate aldolase
MIDFGNYNPAQEEIKSRIKSYLGNELSETEKKEAFKLIFSCIDLTSLEGSDTKVKIFSICERAKTFNETGSGIPNVAAVCFYPPFVKLSKELLKDTGIKVASVAAGFPSGQIPVDLKVAEVNFAVGEGADEIDIVISRGKLLANNCHEVYEEIVALKKACKDAHLKVIL